MKRVKWIIVLCVILVSLNISIHSSYKVETRQETSSLLIFFVIMIKCMKFIIELTGVAILNIHLHFLELHHTPGSSNPPLQFDFSQKKA